MPNIGSFHPVLVHFAIGLCVAGVLLRWLSFSRRAAWAGPAAAVLLLSGSVVVVAAARSGLDAHGPVERVPGSAPAVSEHEHWGDWAHRVFVLVGLLELTALALRSRGLAKPALVASAIAGLGGLYTLYEAGEHGGALVYSYAGGVGIRTGAPEDVGRLLVAGLYQQALLDRKANRPEQAAALIDVLARRFPADPEVQLTAAESQLLDRKDPAAAVTALESLQVPAGERRMRMRRAFLLADALEAKGDKRAARAALEPLLAEFPNSERLKRRVEQLR